MGMIHNGSNTTVEVRIRTRKLQRQEYALTIFHPFIFNLTSKNQNDIGLYFNTGIVYHNMKSRMLRYVNCLVL